MAEPPPSIYKAMINNGYSIFPVSIIDFQGKFWLVPQWLVNDKEEWQTPARIIGLDSVQIQDLRGRGFPTDFSIPAAIPKSVLNALFQGKEVTGWEIIERPPIRFPKQPTMQ